MEARDRDGQVVAEEVGPLDKIMHRAARLLKTTDVQEVTIRKLGTKFEMTAPSPRSALQQALVEELSQMEENEVVNKMVGNMASDLQKQSARERSSKRR